MEAPYCRSTILAAIICPAGGELGDSADPNGGAIHYYAACAALYSSYGFSLEECNVILKERADNYSFECLLVLMFTAWEERLRWNCSTQDLQGIVFGSCEGSQFLECSHTFGRSDHSYCI